MVLCSTRLLKGSSSYCSVIPQGVFLIHRVNLGSLEQHLLFTRGKVKKLKAGKQLLRKWCESCAYPSRYFCSIGKNLAKWPGWLCHGRKWEWKSLSRIWLFATHGLYCLWNSPGQSTVVGSLPFLQRIFPTQGSNPRLLHCRRIFFYQLSHKGRPCHGRRHPI